MQCKQLACSHCVWIKWTEVEHAIPAHDHFILRINKMNPSYTITASFFTLHAKMLWCHTSHKLCWAAAECTKCHALINNCSSMLAACMEVYPPEFVYGQKFTGHSANGSSVTLWVDENFPVYYFTMLQFPCRIVPVGEFGRNPCPNGSELSQTVPQEEEQRVLNLLKSVNFGHITVVV